MKFHRLHQALIPLLIISTPAQALRDRAAISNFYMSRNPLVQALGADSWELTRSARKDRLEAYAKQNCQIHNSLDSTFEFTNDNRLSPAETACVDALMTEYSEVAETVSTNGFRSGKDRVNASMDKYFAACREVGDTNSPLYNRLVDECAKAASRLGYSIATSFERWGESRQMNHLLELRRTIVIEQEKKISELERIVSDLRSTRSTGQTSGATPSQPPAPTQQGQPAGNCVRKGTYTGIQLDLINSCASPVTVDVVRYCDTLNAQGIRRANATVPANSSLTINLPSIFGSYCGSIADSRREDIDRQRF